MTSAQDRGRQAMHVVLDTVSVLNADFAGSMESGAFDTAFERLNDLDISKDEFAGSVIVLVMRLLQMAAHDSGADVDDVLIQVREHIDKEFGG